ncbi:MAG: type I restriction enzyme HsdR N-terminal domain-containing protein [Chromatiales bacterium]|nr:type I restriction enzyme HsdR N-terminal domain-containing protein [Chromatiales bacterium]
MDLIDKINDLASRITRQKDLVMTEEAAKTAFVLPFLQTLGYDVFNPDEVVPEFTADHGVKKGEKVDYAIKRDGQIMILIECKTVGADLAAKHAGQLFRYFSVTDARFGVLTDGVKYLFFSDLESANKMDDRPFFEFNLLGYTETHVEELKKFTRSGFDLETIIGTANKLKYHRALMSEIRQEFESPSEELVRHFAAKVYSGRFTHQVREDFTGLVHGALREYVRERVNDRLKSALDTDKGEQASPASGQLMSAAPVDDSGIETTEDELSGHRIIRAIAAEIADPERVAIRDAKSYCAILFDDNNRRPICRFYFGKTRMAFSVFVPAGEQKFDIAKVNELYKHKAVILEAVQQYL